MSNQQEKRLPPNSVSPSFSMLLCVNAKARLGQYPSQRPTGEIIIKLTPFLHRTKQRKWLDSKGWRSNMMGV